MPKKPPGRTKNKKQSHEGDPVALAKKALCEDDAKLMKQVFDRHPEIKAQINDAVGPFDSPPITMVRSREMLKLFLEAGADINARSRWWAGGFGLLDSAEPELAKFALEKGATLTAHAAARLGMLEELRKLVAKDPNMVHARGGDGQTPLHFASTIPITEFLLDHGAEIDALDVDHVSTPAQYMIEKRQEVARYLVERGCRTDIFMAAALGDLELARKHLEADPECIRMRISEDDFPMCSDKNGGTFYQWTLGWYVSPHQVAKKFGHGEVRKFLDERSPVDVQLLNACWEGEEGKVKSLIGKNAKIPEKARRNSADAARNNNLKAVELMLEARLPVDAKGQHGATPLHWAAWHGNIEMVKLILEYSPPLEVADKDFQGTPLRWSIHGSENGWHRDKGDYAATTEALIRAGSKLPEKLGGTPAVQEVLRRAGVH